MREAEFTIGVEEEFQLVDLESGALRGRIPDLPVDGGSGKEVDRGTQVEAGAPTCVNVTEATRVLAARRRALARLAAEHGLGIAAAGLHPLSPCPAPSAGDPSGLHQLAARRDVAAHDELQSFGLNIHVAVPSREAAVRAMCGAASYIPQLLILTASSPFHRGHDTGFESYRMLLREMAPRGGPPPPVVSAAEYFRLERIVANGRVGFRRTDPIAWDIRPSARLPAVEYRFFDATPWLDAVGLVAAMARALTTMFADRPAPHMTGTEMQLMRENRWNAARHGIDARFYRLDPATGETRTARDALLALVDRLIPIAERLGDGAAIARTDEVLARGSTSTAIRRVYARRGSFPEVAHWMVAETAASAA